jgi:CYTH domain-containing protein
MEEIERKFLLDRPPPVIDDHTPTRIEQGYLAVTDDIEVRIRSRADERVLTVKGGRGLTRREVSIPLTQAQFDALWELTSGSRLTKQRWVISQDAVELEIDVFDGDLGGLVIAEVEFPSEEAAAAFAAPDWFGREVTSDSGYSNATLATKGQPPE